MGNWGPGPLQNDHAQDLLSIERERWCQQIEEVLANPAASWEDIEGYLVYPHLLVSVGAPDPGSLSLRVRSRQAPDSSCDIALRWKSRFVDLTSAGPFRDEQARLDRLAEVHRVFDSLIHLAAANDVPPKARRRAKPKKKG